MSKKLSTESYKGVRDFYPEDQAVQNFIFSTWKKAVEMFGYVEYNASILESTELYKAKSGEEIVNEQTYSFKDRGERDVTLRPEMTPTVARLVAGKRHDLSFPLRWYSIPNLFRYERPQRGRLREHWQLNVDLFGIAGIDAEVEVIKVAAQIMQSLGAIASDYEIRINSRKIVNRAFTDAGLSEEQAYKMQKLIDRKDKISEEDFGTQAEAIIGRAFDIEFAPDEELVAIMEKLNKAGIHNVVYSPSLMRGFDYYTGIVFEVFDTHPDNNRALMGGGRYDDLLALFGGEKIPAVGLGMGDVTAKDFLEVRGLLQIPASTVQVYLVSATDNTDGINDIADILRSNSLNVAVDYSKKKIGDQIKKADKDKIPYIIVIGDDELTSNQYKLKNLMTGTETTLPLNQVAHFIKEKTVQ